MKIAFVNQPIDNLIPPYQNSIGLWTYHVAPHVAKQHDVIVFGRRSKTQREWNGQDNVQYEFTPLVLPNRSIIELRNRFSLRGGGKLPSYASQLNYIDYILQIAVRIRIERVDVVHIHNFTQFVPVIRALNPNSKIVLHMNGEWLSQLDYDTMDQRLNQTDTVFGSSNYITNKIKERFPHHAHMCRTVYNGVNTDLFHPQNNNGRSRSSKVNRLLFVGRVSPEKGVHDLIKAFLQVVKTYPGAQLDVVGPVGAMPLEFLVGVSDDPEVRGLTEWYRTDYFVLLNELIPEEYNHNIQFHGSLGQMDLVRLYQSADVLVNSSYSESFGMSLVEAMACEKPVVATRVGGMVEITDNGKVGTLVQRGDIDALAEGLLELLANPDKRDLLGKEGRERVLDLFDWAQIARNAVGYYKGEF